MANLDNSDASGLLVPDVNEDSVDIYDDLEMGCHSNAEKWPPDTSQLKESMDLYEELVTEEQRSKEASYTELKSRFQAAQNQINELRRRLEQVEMQNTGLNTENFRLKKNISALLQTARQEVTRKDAEIQRLNQLSLKGRHHHQSHFNNIWDKNSSTMTSTGSSRSRPPPPPPPPSCPPPPCPPPPLPLTLPPKENQCLLDTPQSSRTESYSSASHTIGSCTETQASKASSYSRSKSSSRGGCEIPDKQTGQFVSKLGSSSSSHHSDSDRHKSKHREKKYQSHKPSESTDRRPRVDSYPTKDCHDPDKNRSHKEDKDLGRKYDSRSCKNRSYQNVEGHRRSDRSKSPPPESSHGAVPSEDTKGRSRERTQDKAKLAPSESQQSTVRSSKEGHGREHRVRTSDGRHRSSDSKDRKKSSKEREEERLPKDRQRKEERRGEDEIGRKHKRSSLSEMSREKKRPKESDNGKVDVCNKERQEKIHKDVKSSSKEPHVTEKISGEENSPNRKLCFMETLNLTLSPIKKPVLPIDASQDVLTPDEENSQCFIEDMCVIDEVDSSELKAEFEDVEEQSQGIPKESSSEEKCEDVQEKDESLNKSVPGKVLEDDTVQKNTSAPSQAQDTSENKGTLHVMPKSTEMSSLKETEGDEPNSMASDSQVDKCKKVEVTDGVSDLSGSSNSLLKNHEQNTTPDLHIVHESKAEKISSPMDSIKNVATTSPSQDPVAKDIPVSLRAQQISATILPEDSQQELHSPTSFGSKHKKGACGIEDGSKDTEAVSSTISLESLPQEGLSLSEAILVLTQTDEEANDGSSAVTEPSSSSGCIAVSKVSSTTEETVLLGKSPGLGFTPKKSFGPGKIHENHAEPSSSVPVYHDEDSMMRTLSNLKRIPDAISPLRSPIRITKRSHVHVLGKPGHVKSLQKEFSSPVVDVNSKKVDVNKENKYPGSTPEQTNQDPHNMVDKDKESNMHLTLSEAELEEGEILSESDDAPSDSAVPTNKRSKLARPVRNKPSPKPVLRSQSEETTETAGSSTRSPKSRFKTVCPSATKASFSTIEEIMETFKLVRTEIRKKYMKLHKTFPKKSFYGMMDNFQESFLEFVDGAHFGQICSEAGELKSRLKKVIASVFIKVSNNGIVKRIFEQQAVDMKQKLWDFVDDQVDCMFKDIQITLKSLCKAEIALSEDKKTKGNERVSGEPSPKKPQLQQAESQSAPASLNRIRPCAVVPYRTGLGSRGKDIRITHVERGRSIDPRTTDCSSTKTTINLPPPKNTPFSPEKNSMTSLLLSQNSSLLDRTDFDLLTEQQASSLTFNLVRDSQMGEIFKCLLQGSDLLESSGITGDSTGWSLSTPRKDGERFISITTPTKFDSPSKLLTPGKFNTPSKLITTWASISPRKMSSPRSKDQVPLNPALFDESCMLELPSANKAMQQRSYSVLAEDLAVSLTIPSPLKSDSHLSFLQPSSMRLVSTPESVISAHISEDALLDGEDATEQDIHLALDTDNSSCGSDSSSAASAAHATFLFKPDVPMQALVMERSNDHFIVKIRQTATCADSTLTADESLSQTLTEEDPGHVSDTESEESGVKVLLWDRLPCDTPSEDSLCKSTESPKICRATTGLQICLTEDVSSKLSKDPSHTKEDISKCRESVRNRTLITPSENCLQSDAQSSDPISAQISQSAPGEGIATDESTSQTHRREKHTRPKTSPSKAPRKSITPDHSTDSPETNEASQAAPSCVSDSERDGVEVSKRRLTSTEDMSSTLEDPSNCDRGRKRKKHQDKSKAKRPRTKEAGSTEETASKKDDNESISSPASLSPNSLSAKNVVRKKGEVVIAWTRDEDRAILVELKTKGASRDTFSDLSEKLNKPSGQIAHRFNQLVKLFKKQEKKDP